MLAADNHEAWKARTALEVCIASTFSSAINGEAPPPRIPARRPPSAGVAQRERVCGGGVGGAPAALVEYMTEDTTKMQL